MLYSVIGYLTHVCNILAPIEISGKDQTSRSRVQGQEFKVKRTFQNYNLESSAIASAIAGLYPLLTLPFFSAEAS